MRLMGNGSENTVDDGRSMAAKVIYIYIYAGWVCAVTRRVCLVVARRDVGI